VIWFGSLLLVWYQKSSDFAGINKESKQSATETLTQFLSSLYEGSTWLLCVISIKRMIMPISASNLHLRPNVLGFKIC